MNTIQNNVMIQFNQKSALPPDASDHNLFQTEARKNQIMENYLHNKKTIADIWKDNFNMRSTFPDLSLNVKTTMTWTNQNNNVEVRREEDEVTVKEEIRSPTPTPLTNTEKEEEPAHHARRPMNAFLIFCKKHRPIVRKKYPTLENRGVTRILGEWWALLDSCDKEPYTNLAKEYKDAFFTANPNFKWYKLPAPPLRPGGATTRPISIKTETVLSPSSTETSPHEAEFTPGKLADESQLGLLSSLLNSSTNFSGSKTQESESFKVQEKIKSTLEQNNNVDKPEEDEDDDEEEETESFGTGKLELTPENTQNTLSLPPKPIKKRFYDVNLDNKNVARNIFEVKRDISDMFEGPKHNQENADDNMTNQDLMERVVESMYAKQKSKNFSGKSKSKETQRMPGRSCKGKRYAEFMRNGKLLKNKRDKRSMDFNFQSVNEKFDYELLNNKVETPSSNKVEIQTPKLALENTIKRLAERTNVKLEETSEPVAIESTQLREKTTSECSDELHIQGTSNFNLELRIDELPSLSYETYLQRKRDSKKRKLMRKPTSSSSSKVPKIEIPPAPCNNNNTALIGSKKRKNKNNITHLQKEEKTQFISSTPAGNDLSGLATLAEIAANTEKIN